ncbi:MAG: DUF58 domain-containing protein [Lachnospiraceae bacterium]|nr:DUF58 domain-containing protein [Lachnospiraceae bacterium]
MKGKNLIYIFTYIVAVLVVLLGALFYRQPVLTALLLLMFLIPVLSIVLCYRAKDNLRVFFDALPLAVPSGENTHPVIKLNVENTGFIPLLNCSMDFKYQNRFYPNETLHSIVFAAPLKSLSTYDIEFDASVPGLLELEAGNLCVTDLLHLKTWKLPFQKTLKTAILPQEKEIENVEVKKASLEEEAENSLTGELSREIRQIREYAPGDRLRDMHWKQTARLDTPMVREFERMRESFYVLYPVVETRETSADGGNVVSATLSLWYSLVVKLIKQGETIYTVVYDADSRTFERIKASSEDELVQTVYELYCSIVPNFRVSEEMLGRIREEIPDVVVIRDGKLMNGD